MDRGDPLAAPKSFHHRPKWRGWQRPLEHFGIFIAVASMALAFILGPLLGGFKGGYIADHTLMSPWPFVSILVPSCYPDSGFVGIDAPVVRLSFAGAKGVDLAWNWAAGRGFQVLFILLAYRVSTDALVKAAQEHSIPLHAFVALAISPTSPASLLQLPLALAKGTGWRIRALVAWCILSIIFLASFPSLMDLSSGYDSFQAMSLSIPGTDSTRLDTSTSGGARDSYNSIDSAIMGLFTEYKVNVTLNSLGYSRPGNVSNLRWHDATLQASWDAFYNETFLRSPTTNIQSAVDDGAHGFYLSDANHYQCVVQQGVYSWGFASSWFLTSGIISTLWLFGMWMVWVDADHNGEFCRKRRRMGTYRAIVDIAEVLRDELGTELGAYSDSELRKVAGKVPRIKYYVALAEEDGPPQIGLSTWQSPKVRLEWGKLYS